MNELLLFADKRQLNEATTWYVATIGTAAEALGFKVRHVTTLSEIQGQAAVLVLECKSAFLLSLLRPRARVWLWMQGVFPEEARLHFGSRWREALWRVFEWVALPRMQGVVMVSRAMQLHFRTRYPRLKLQTFVMPCVNAELVEACFRLPGKYTRPSFVYAGSLHRWQCLPETLAVFKKVKAVCADAQLSIFTKDTDEARQLVAVMGLDDVLVEQVALPELQNRLAAFKYGFVLRDDHVVNRVATPTKVSSYMAAGVIPVTTRAVDDYTAAFAGVEPLVMSDQLNVEWIAHDVLKHESRQLNAEQVLASYRQLFGRYFDHSAYLPGLREFFKSTGLQSR